MKKIALILAVCLCAAAPLLADGTNVLTDARSRTSYAIGVAVARNLARTLQMQDVQVDPALVARAVTDILSSNATLLTAEEIQQTLATLQTEVQTRTQARQIELAATNLVLAQAFLAANKTNTGVVTLPDGLQYQVITQGNGEIPGDSNVVLANFHITLLDGKEFESSPAGKPVPISVASVFPGWSEALKLMKAGSKWRLFIPPDLAFGPNGLAPRVPPNSALILDVELVSIERPNQSSAAAPPPANPPLTSDIIKVPSAEELKKGAKVEIIKQEDLQKLQQQQASPAK
jgi:FKBP-type peptidyl-prolyl cis-trans isomerase FklB